MAHLFSMDRPNLPVDDMFGRVSMVERCSCLNGGEFKLQTSSCYGIIRKGRNDVMATGQWPAKGEKND